MNAETISRNSVVADEVGVITGQFDFLDNIFDRWLFYEHYESWKEVQERKRIREEEESDSTNILELNADSMAQLADMMRRAAMAADAAR